METNAVILKIDGEHLVKALQKAHEELVGAEGDLMLDFSAVHRLDASGMGALKELADAADHKALKIVLRGVNVEIYKVLKLVKLAPRFKLVS